VDKSPTPNAKKTALEFSKALSPSGAQNSPGGGGAFSSKAAPSPNPASRRPDE
jgi:hypothetical protein